MLYLSPHLGKFELILQKDLSTGVEGVLELARDIIEEMRGDPDDLKPPGGTGVAKWCKGLARGIVRQAAKTRKRWWIVLDGVGGEERDPDLNRFAQNLAAEIALREDDLCLRLILLDYKDDIVAIPRGAIIAEDLTPRAFVRMEDLERYFTILMKSTGTIEDGSAVLKVVTEVEQALGGARELPRVAEEVRNVTRRLLGQSAPAAAAVAGGR
jgi:hypothetical protein